MITIDDIATTDLEVIENTEEITIADKDAVLVYFNSQLNKDAAITYATNEFDNVLGVTFSVWDGVSDIVFPRVTFTPTQFKEYIAKHGHAEGDIVIGTRGGVVEFYQCHEVEGTAHFTSQRASDVCTELREEQIKGIAVEKLFTDALAQG